MGATLALPFLDAMTPSFSAAAKPVPRFVWTYVPNGTLMENWFPVGEGNDFQLSPVLKPLAPFKDKLVVARGLTSNGAVTKGIARGPHTRCAAAYLSGVTPRYTEGADFECAKTADQYAADALGGETPLRSIEIALEANFMTGNCDNGFACIYQSAMSWQTPTMPLAGETNPRVIFERMFGDGSSGAVRLARLERKRSLLDAINQDMTRLRQQLGPADQHKMDEYTDTIRSVERQIQRAEQRTDASALPSDQPRGVPDSYDEHAKLMFDLLVLGFQADITRVSTYQLSREQSDRPYPEAGVRDGHHATSHHGYVPEKVAALTRINAYHYGLVAYFLDKLSRTADGDGTLLDRVAVIQGSGMGFSDTHDPTNLPISVIGGLCGQLKGNRVLAFPAGKIPWMNLNLGLFQLAGINIERVCDSTVPLVGL
jgi:hypothetical protein